jgi:hypothetical protein
MACREQFQTKGVERKLQGYKYVGAGHTGDDC